MTTHKRPGATWHILTRERGPFAQWAHQTAHRIKQDALDDAQDYRDSGLVVRVLKGTDSFEVAAFITRALNQKEGRTA